MPKNSPPTRNGREYPQGRVARATKIGSKSSRKTIAIRIILIIILVLCVAVSIRYYIFAAQFEYQQNSYVRSRIQTGDIRGAYDFYFSGDPLVRAHPFVGNRSAPLTLIIVVDFASPTSAQGYRTLIPNLSEQYGKPGALRIIHKYYLPRDEYESRTGRFIYAQAALCYDETGGNDTIAFHDALFRVPNATERIIITTAMQFGAAPPGFVTCLRGPSNPALEQDMIETDVLRIESPSLWIGIDGQDNIVLYGIPSQDQVRQAIRTKQVGIGI